jgi:PKD repeat protein/uncharacterized protein YjdB
MRRALLGVAACLVAPLSCRDNPEQPEHPVAPAMDVASGASAVIVGAGDIARCDGQNDEATAALLDSIPGTVITLGDNVLGGSTTPPDFNNCYNPSWGRHKARTRPSVGSYEYFSPGAATYWQYFGAAAGDSGKGYYSYDVGTWHVVVLNSGINMAKGSPQEQWLASDLSAHPTQCTLAYWHMPRFSSAPSSGGVQVQPSIKPLWDDLYAVGAEVVLNAHYQVYERFAPQDTDGNSDPTRGIREFIVGTGGISTNAFNATPLPNSEVRNTGAPGVLQLTLSDGSYAWKFIPIPGKTFTDSGQSSCHGTQASNSIGAVTVSPTTATIEVGATVQFTAAAHDANGQPITGKSTTWSSSNPAVARINAAGVATGWAPGTVTITATVDGQPGTALLTVNATTAQILVGAGDIATCNALGDEATAKLLDEIPGTVFTAGDNAYDNGTPDEYTNCYDPSWGRHKARTRPAPGNHEYTTPGAPGYFGYFGAAAGDSTKGYYSYDLGAWHVIVLNNYKSMAAGTAQETWLRADLAASTKQCTVAIWHEPLFTSGMTHAGAGRVQPLWQALYAAGGELVVTGHDHDYERFAPQNPTGGADPSYGIREIISGTGGAGLGSFTATVPNTEAQNNSAHGVLKLTLRDNGYSWQFIPEAGQTFSDSGSGGCHGAPPNQLPTAAYTASCSSLTCAFTDASSDPDGHIVNWSWFFGDGATATTQSPSHSYAAAGTYSVRLIATDDKGGEASLKKTIVVGGTTNQPPTAAYGASCAGLSCTFSDSSTDADGSVTAWSWSFGDGATATTRNPAHNYAAAGTYSVTLTVTDDKGATGAHTQAITVTAANQPPTVNAGPDASMSAGTYTLQASFTDPNDTGPWTYVIDWGDLLQSSGSTTGQTISASHPYVAPGTYTIRVTVTDPRGASGSDTLVLTVHVP